MAPTDAFRMGTVDVPISIWLIGVALVLGLAYSLYSTATAHRPIRGLPLVYLPEEGLSPRNSWTSQAERTIRKGLAEYDGRPFQIMTGTGPKVVLANHYSEELKNHADVLFGKAFIRDFFVTLPGFEPFKEGLSHDGFIAEVVRTKLTQSLGLITADLVDETTQAVHELFGEAPDWHDVALKQTVLDLVSRLSSRVFLGKDLCRNQRWLELARDYTVDAFMASRVLKTVHPLLRPVMHWFLEPCRRLRRDVRDARAIIEPEVARRKARAQKLVEAGEKAPKTADTVGWMYEVAREKRSVVDFAAGQLSLTTAAIHTTSEGLTQALFDMVAHPEVIQPLREEVISVIRADSWSKMSLYKLRLMDSFLKESQRMNPPSIVSMNRYVERTLTLSTGETLARGTQLLVAGRYDDPSAYAEPSTFDAWRFARAREAPSSTASSSANAGTSGNASNQHVSVSPEHFAFGYGRHACPGRFFASNEMKIALAHLLLKYDWRAAGVGSEKAAAGAAAAPDEAVAAMRMRVEAANLTVPNSVLQIRRRREEISIDLAME